jgi:hypothetical protein
MSRNPEVVAEMNAKNSDLIRQCESSIVSKSERKGGRIRYEIHHIIPASEGGSVYDIDNLVIRTPARHDTIHKELRERGKTQ